MTAALAEASPPPERPQSAFPLPVVLALGAVYVIWGSTYLAIRFVVESMPPLLSGGVRFMTAGLVLLAVARARGEAPVTLADLRRAVIPGALLFLVGNGFVAVAEKGLPSSLAAVVCATMPLFATALGHATGQKARAGEWVGLGFGFAGVVLLSAGDLRHVPALGLLLILAPMGWALGSLLARRAGGRGGLVATATPMLSGGAVTAIAGLLAGEPLHIASDARAVVAWLYLVVFGSLVAFSAYSYLLRTTPPAVATSYAFVNPVLAVLLGVAVGGEALTPTAGIAGALVAAGVALVLRARRVPAKVTPSPAAAPRGYSPR